MVAAMGLVQKLVPLQSKMRSYVKVLVKDKLRTSLVLLALLFFTTWSFHHASMRFNPTTPPTLFTGSGTAAKNLPTAEPSSTSSSPSTSPPEPERATRTKKKKGKKANALTGSPKKQHNGKKSAADDDRKTDPSTSALRSHYEELLNAVEQYGNKTIPVEITTRFQKIEEECRRPHTSLDLTSHLCGLSGIAIFIAAYASVVMEERLSQGGAHYHKSVPMTIAAGLIWILIALEYRIIAPHMLGEVESAFRESFLEFGETFLFLVVAMTYINTMEALDVFQCIKVFLVDRRLTLRQLFWATGVLSFLLSPLADNLTTALLMGAVIRSVGSNSKDENFITLSLINVVVASNAGGAFSPFGDITTLMIWQKGKLGMTDFQHIVLPSVVNWLVPAVCISRALPEGQRPPLSSEKSKLSPKALMVILLFFFTIAMTALLHAWLHLPAVLGMMTGLGLLQLFGYVSQRLQMDGATQQNKQGATSGDELAAAPPSHHHHHHHHQQHQHSLFSLLANIDWDTLLFFYGVIVSVGGLGVMGYLGAIARFAYQDLGPKPANILIGGLSALIDNIPVLYAVLVANPTMVRADWMLVTLTAGCGGSILSFGSAAGVGLMGQEPTHYNFHKHLRWSWAIILGYIASILAHFAMNGF